MAKSVAQPGPAEKALKSPPSSVSELSQQDSEDNRGRRQDRDLNDSCSKDSGSGVEAEDTLSPTSTPQHRKRKRSRKGLDKKFECPHEGCGKSYSRAEHLYRHQLNHNPKQIYKCDFPDCVRTFVRQDLCARHRERHTARGSHLQRKDSYIHSIDVGTTRPPSGGGVEHYGSKFQPMHGQPPQNRSPTANSGPYVPPLEIPPVPVRSATSAPSTVSEYPHAPSHPVPADQFKTAKSYHTPPSSTYAPLSHINRSSRDEQYYDEPMVRSVSSYDSNQRQSTFDSINSSRYQKPYTASPRTPRSATPSVTSPTQYRTAPTSYTASQSQNGSVHSSMKNTQTNGSYQTQQVPPISTLPPPIYPTMSHISPLPSHNSYGSHSNSFPSRDGSGVTMSAENGVDIGPDGTPTMPVFGEDGYTRSPLIMADDFTAWLFNDPRDRFIASSPMAYSRGSMSVGSSAFMGNGDHGALNGNSGTVLPQQHPMAVTSILDPAMSQTILSEEKRQQVLDLIDGRFNERDDPAVRNQKTALLDGDRDEESHVLSLRMMQTYIGSYWYHFHPQMPILHKPTFCADRAQNLLLIAIICLGASCLDKIHGASVTKSGAELSNFLGWHLRGEVFDDADFRPPAKLWIFQTLLLLEVYEKMYSTRILHERAHIHHATTLTLMRRGSSLLGRSPLDSPPVLSEEKSGSYTNGFHRVAIADTPDLWWNHWITNEGTRRVAFAAFIVDSIHATMFGHSVTMVAHEMRLPLPCDENLWSATSGMEVGRIEANLHAQGIKPISFLDGLKRTLGGHTVRTNPFGRTALMAGLLSVNLHMQQRDVQRRSLGQSILGGKEIWRGSVTRSFDFWKTDFDAAAKDNPNSVNFHHQPHGRVDEENIFESRVVLHHLAHMAMHVDVVQLQIFARASRLLGRTITPQDYSREQKRICDYWAPKASARDATFFALRFLAQVLTPDIYSNQSNSTLGNPSSRFEYSARDDFLLNRPWVLYFAALIVWSYGYALDGPLWQPPTLSTVDEQVQDLRKFLKRVGGVNKPDDLEHLQGRNECMGMLMLLRDMFYRCRWELLHEAANLLNNCIDMLQRNR